MSHEFDEFWSQYPRKVAKHPARLVWGRMAEADRRDAMQALPAHLRYWKFAGTQAEFIPHARTWLHQRRWEDEVELPSTEKVTAWWATEDGVMKKGRELQLAPRPGEDMAQYKVRVVNAMRSAA